MRKIINSCEAHFRMNAPKATAILKNAVRLTEKRESALYYAIFPHLKEKVA